MNVMNYATRDVVTLPPSASIDSAISSMEERNIHHVVITTGNRVVGMVSDRDILISTGWMLSIERTSRNGGAGMNKVVGPTQVHEIMSRPVVCLTIAHTARDAALLMLDRKISAVPVLNQDRLDGLITETDLLKWPPLSEVETDHLLTHKVGDLMRVNVLSVTPDAPLADVIHLFRTRRIRHAPVVLRSKLVGIVSDRDVRRALGWASVRDMQAEREGRMLDTVSPQTAGDVMQQHVRTAELSTVLRDALRLMLEERIHSLPVVEAQCLKGIVTETDFLRAFARKALL